MKYHDICLWLPYKEELVDEIADDISRNGYREDKPIILYQGKILDGRHRYEAAVKVGVDPWYQEFVGDKEQAIKYVTSENVKRRMLSNREKEFFYTKRADALGVRKREDTLKQNATDVSNDTTALSQEQHADDLGVARPTVARWEKDRKEIKSDPELANKADTFEGYVEAKKEVQKRRKATKEEAEKIAKLKSLGERSEAEAGNVDKKLDRYREQGIDVDDVQSQKEKDAAREAYRERHRPFKEMAEEMARVAIDEQKYAFVAALAMAAYPEEGEIEHALNIIKKGS